MLYRLFFKRLCILSERPEIRKNKTHRHRAITLVIVVLASKTLKAALLIFFCFLCGIKVLDQTRYETLPE